MDSVKTVLLAALALVATGFLLVWFRSVRRGRTTALRDGSLAPPPAQTAIGFVTNFFDTLGIGSFAATTSIFRLWRVVLDERIPGTLNVGHAPPVIV